MGKIIEYIKFLASLPELTKPGIDEESVYNFLKQFSKENSPALLKFIASKFMNVLPDRNYLSPLELMMFVNTAQQYNHGDELSFCLGVEKVVKNYDRSLLKFDDLLNSIHANSRHGSNFQYTIAPSLEKELIALSNESKKEKLAINTPKYLSLLKKAEKLRKQYHDDEASWNLEEAVLANPRRSEAYFAVSELYVENNRIDDSISVLTALLSTEPCEPVRSLAYLFRADRFMVQGDFASALRDLKYVSNSDYRKYDLEKVCVRKTNGYLNSVVTSIKSGFKELWHCYAVPAWKYNKSKKKPKFMQRSHKNFLFSGIANAWYYVINWGDFLIKTL